MSPKGRILEVEDGGSVWSMLYQPEEGGLDRVTFEWRELAHFYEGVSGRSFYRDYNFGAGRDTIEKYFKGRTLLVEGEDFDESVSLQD
jgi:hypothetical protein